MQAVMVTVVGRQHPEVVCSAEAVPSRLIVSNGSPGTVYEPSFILGRVQCTVIGTEREAR